ncbi:MAG: DUF3054 domain-containing protein [Thermoleophilia bacterium]|nr:DUF3054 domain-containing protein [Thermoleophilia bacterium]
MTRTPLILATDIVAVLAFALAGRRSHDEGAAVAGVVRTALPFAGGVVAGWLACRAWRDPAAGATGLVVWVAAVAVGMLLRVAFTDGGAPASFVAVATVALGVLILGWRLVARGLSGRVATWGGR